MFRSLMGFLGGSSERGAPSRRATLGVESLDGRVMPSATIASPHLFLAAIADPPGPRDGEEIPTLTRARSAGEEIPQPQRGEVGLHPEKGSKGEEIPWWAGPRPGEVSLNVSRNAGEEIPS